MIIDITGLVNETNISLLLQVLEVVGVLGATFFAARSAKLSHQSLLQQQRNEEPEVVVFVKQAEESLNIIDLIVKNEGIKSARNINFKVAGTNINALTDRKIKDIAILKNGIALLAGGGEIRQPLGVMLGDSYKEYKRSNTKVKVKYNDGHNNQKEGDFHLDFNGLVDRKLGMSNFESIAKSLSSVQSELHEIKKDIHIVANKGITEIFPESITYHGKHEVTGELK